ncbi:regulatory protein, tetR family [Raineyella antarctica]|uniref:Regulatory protein, tetR family n=1 Tax=Raineyella antarctica TaxID=1577474 RepID=A0A1G6GH66_9ACTN|nr:TetR/AcrR family transcriptional regulator [Raineyella antarctica]SDB80526.1 regulatory protein, tetR family [Raineyella antarctica]
MSDAPDPDAPRTARQIGRQEMTRRILARARAQLLDAGPGELSLRAIARDLGIASSAIYRYFASRDELLTALLVEVYAELGAVLEEADRAVRPREAYARRFRTLAQALRDWAVAHPYDWALLYGSPVPGYHAPQDTVPSAAEATGAFLAIVSDASGAGYRLPAELAAPVDPAERAAVAGLVGMLEGPVDEALLLRGMAAWSGVMGAISTELFGHLNRSVVDLDTYYAAVVDRLVEMSGLRDSGAAHR